MRIDGQIAIGEGSRWAAQACARLSNRPLLYVGSIAGSLIAIGVGVFAAVTLIDRFGAPGWSFLPIMLAVMSPGLVLMTRGMRRFAVAQYRRKLKVRGVSDPLAWRFESDTEGFVYAVGDVENHVKWRAVSEIFPVGPYWILLVQGSAIYIPKRHLGGEDAERAFLGEVLGHLDAAGRDRSAAAMRLARPALV